MSELREKLNLLPDNPGVYVMLDKDGVVIYVGKARVLKNRVRQYFHSSAKPEKVTAMVEHIADFYYIITKFGEIITSYISIIIRYNTYCNK